ncbi:peptidoglycan DD-metalloendopeptidase family protein [Paraburkholderia sp. MMS20-SJTR3]|uniref:Peptidoglycan DD-metalloendopeptidase family protein n=1 Tax=Paraburkholderia sejongensis TaxID=2886946 RepID=A0ABS8K3F3_9BURK|nr:peptidoglycan DD-metalloendopeptidase family protein [Paraburkholderia sp. MMS20-SJTR3]MCC8396666.1 peptidoglycan DD-metalloendopeptidase family protein [Paraburkholderia sp. MMS20-SJTR3]
MRKRFDRTIVAGVAGVWAALALGGCANIGQQNAQDGAATNVAAASGAAANGVGAAAATLAGSAPLPSDADGNAASKKAPVLVYRVRRGDTLARVAQHHHVSVKQLQAWNGLKAAARLKPGQVLHVASPETARAVREANANAAAARAAASAQAGPQNSSQLAGQQPAAAAAPAVDAADVRQVTQETRRHASSVTLAWPAAGRVVEAFQPGETRGIEIGGKAGDPVRAAADGKVMYAGTGLNSYGSLIIVQHNKDFLTAYSHNRKLLVKMGDVVRKGQQIAEMGDESNSRVSVGFELRRDGKPVDPLPYLPRG